MNLIKNQIINIKNNITSIILIKPLFVWLYHKHGMIKKEGEWQSCQKNIVGTVRGHVIFEKIIKILVDVNNFW